jgi:hypothetical protein
LITNVFSSDINAIRVFHHISAVHKEFYCLILREIERIARIKTCNRIHILWCILSITASLIECGLSDIHEALAGHLSQAIISEEPLWAVAYFLSNILCCAIVLS